MICFTHTLACMCPCSFLLQRVFYFPLTERLEKLLKIPAYRQALQHEFERPKNADYMTDVYDSPAWKEFMGAATVDLKRIGWLFCVDGIPAFAAGTLSLKPAEFINLSLPPGVRSKAENILLMMLLPSSLTKGQAQKKYYDFAAAFELNDLATTGRFQFAVRLVGTDNPHPNTRCSPGWCSCSPGWCSSQGFLNQHGYQRT